MYFLWTAADLPSFCVAPEVIWNLAGIDSNRASILYAGGVKKSSQNSRFTRANAFSSRYDALFELRASVG